MKKLFKLLLTLFLWSATIGIIWSASRTTEEKVFIQLWFSKSDYQKITDQCKTVKEAELDYQNGDYLVIPCSALEKK